MAQIINKVFESGYVIKMRVDILSYDTALREILQMCDDKAFGYVCAASVHMVMETFDSGDYRKIVNSANLITADGVPVVWALKFMGYKNASRVCGPDLSSLICSVSANNNIPIGFLGSTDNVLELLKKNLKNKYPGINIVFQDSPPFRGLSDDEDRIIVDAINSSGTKVLFVGLGCPKQERWMAEHVGKVKAVMIGVGAAFDFFAGTKKRSPGWMSRLGLEWLFRLSQEPRRLWKRYFYHNPRFIYYVGRQIFGLDKY